MYFKIPRPTLKNVVIAVVEFFLLVYFLQTIIGWGIYAITYQSLPEPIRTTVSGAPIDSIANAWRVYVIAEIKSIPEYARFSKRLTEPPGSGDTDTDHPTQEQLNAPGVSK